MHDPMTQAFQIFGPRGLWYRWKKDRAMRNGDPHWARIRFIDPLAVIWHVDPEVDGSDDSCGYSYARLTKEEREKAQKLAKELATCEYEGMFRAGDGGYYTQRPHLETILGAFVVVAWRVFRRSVAPRHLPRILSAATNPTDNLHSLLKGPLDLMDVERFICIVAKNFKTYQRRWWNYPRWHVWHWKIQFPWLIDLKRYLFSRCAGCGKGFSYGYAPVTGQWNSKGPQWFKSEQGKYHEGCYGRDVAKPAMGHAETSA